MTDRHDDPNLEALLASLVLPWTRQAISLAEIDWETTKAHQVRKQAVDEDAVDRYTTALENGEVFPAVLVTVTGDLWEIVGGVHRAMAHDRAGFSEIEAYVVKRLSSVQRLELAIGHNTRHGIPLTTAERAELAHKLTVEHDLTATEAAKICGVRPNDVSSYRIRQRGLALAREIGLPRRWDRLSVSAQTRLAGSALAHSDALFVEALNTASNCDLKTQGVFELASLISAAETEVDAWQIVEDYESEHHPAKARNSSSSKSGGASTLHQYLMRINALDPAAVARSSTDPGYTLNLITRAGQKLADITRRLPQEWD